MNYSAAYLVKRSTKQLNYFIRHMPAEKVNDSILIDPFEVIPSERQVKGNASAESKAESPYVEMLGIFKHRDISIYFSIDEIRRKSRRDYIIEHKWLEDPDEVEDWFFLQSIIQTAFLGSLSSFVKNFKTAGFVANDKPRHELVLKDKFFTRLQFGEKQYDIKFEPLPIMRFFLTKARAAQKFSRAKQFDDSFRFNEWSYFKDYIKYRKL